MCDIRTGRENEGTPAATTRETQTMWDAGDLRYDFNALTNSTSLTNKIKLLSQQTLQHGQKADFGVACDIMLLLWHQMLGTG